MTAVEFIAAALAGTSELEWQTVQLGQDLDDADAEIERLSGQLARDRDLIARYESEALADHYAQLPAEVRPPAEPLTEDGIALMAEIDTYLESQ